MNKNWDLRASRFKFRDTSGVWVSFDVILSSHATRADAIEAHARALKNRNLVNVMGLGSRLGRDGPYSKLSADHFFCPHVVHNSVPVDRSGS